MKRWIAVMSVVAVLGAGSLRAMEGHDHSAAPAAGSVRGEVLDMACYMAHEGKGDKHKACAASCLKDGAPAGLLTKDGRVYLLVEDHNAKKPYEKVRGMAAEQVVVSGDVVSRGGVQAVVVKSAEKAK